MAEFSNVVFALLFFTAIVVGVSLYWQDLSQQSGTGHTVGNLSGLSQVGQLEQQLNNTQESLINAPLTGTIIDVPLVIVSGVYNTVKILWVTLTTTTGTFISAVAYYLFLPPWVIGIVMSLLAAYLIFALISAVLRWKL